MNHHHVSIEGCSEGEGVSTVTSSATSSRSVTPAPTPSPAPSPSQFVPWGNAKVCFRPVPFRPSSSPVLAVDTEDDDEGCGAISEDELDEVPETPPHMMPRFLSSRIRSPGPFADPRGPRQPFASLAGGAVTPVDGLAAIEGLSQGPFSPSCYSTPTRPAQVLSTPCTPMKFGHATISPFSPVTPFGFGMKPSSSPTFNDLLSLSSLKPRKLEF